MAVVRLAGWLAGWLAVGQYTWNNSVVLMTELWRAAEKQTTWET
jgi:hypothetical protein